jgi:hypothetical protein
MKEFVELTFLAIAPWRPPNALFPMATSMCTLKLKKTIPFIFNVSKPFRGE